MSLNFKRYAVDDAELDVTSFMNLMIVLVPVLLLSLTFSQITAHEIKLPSLEQSTESAGDTPPQLEVVMSPKGFQLYYPSNTLIQEVPMQTLEDGFVYDFQQLQLVLLEVKKQLPERRDILLLAESSVDYQSLVSGMDAIKSYKTTVAASVVQVELFPEISLANASVK